MNFLPQNMQRAFARDRIIRLLSACGFSVFILSIVSLALLIPPYLAVLSDKEERIQNISELKKATQATELETALAGHAATLRAYIPASGVASYKPLNLLREVLAARPQGISITGWSMARGSREGTFQIQGTGITRDALLSFRTAVRALPFSRDANYSQQILTVKDNTNTLFTLTIILK